jgi:flagellar assembly factor FliW
MTSNLAENTEVSMEKIKLSSTKLGEIEYTENDIILLSSPLLGFPDLSDFLLISSEKSFPFLWFQSIQDADVCFILIEPKIFHPNYDPKLNKRELKILGVEESEHLKVLAIVVVPEDPKNATVNLRAPILVNTEKKLAKQVILEDDRWMIKAPLFAAKDK